MKIGELAKAAGVTKDTVRHYVEIGLLTAARDPNNGYQAFSPTSLDRLRFIKSAQNLGFRLEDIQLIFRDADDHQSPCPRVRDIIVERIAETRQRIAELTRLCENMDTAVAVWEAMPNGIPNGHSICQLIESPLDQEQPASDHSHEQDAVVVQTA